MRKLLPLLLCMLLLVGCGANNGTVQLSGQTKTLEIVLTDNEVLQMQIPIEMIPEIQDNNHYFQFSDNVLIIRMMSTVTTSKYNEQLDLYLSAKSATRMFDNCSVVVQADGTLLSALTDALSKATVVTKTFYLDDDKQLAFLPAYNRMDMVLDGNIYMPENCVPVQFDVYEAKLYCEGNGWLQSYIMDSTFDDLLPKILTLVTNNTGSSEIKGWYKNDEMFYCYTDTTVVGVKKLAFNTWYIYQGSIDMSDYVLTGINTIHG